MKKSHVVNLLFVGLLSGSSVFSQNNKTVLAFSESIEQEKKLEYTLAIETMLGLKDSTTYEVNMRLGWLNYKAGFKKKSMNYKI